MAVFLFLISVKIREYLHAVILGFFYAVLATVSLWRIVRKYWQLKREGK